MNVIRDILSGNESFDVDSNILKTVAEIKYFQKNVREYIDANYKDFLADVTNNQIYIEEGNNIIDEAENLLQNIQNETKVELSAASEEIKLCFEELAELTIETKTYMKILKIDDLFQKLDRAKESEEQLKVMETVFELKTLIYDAADKIFPKLDCFQNIKIKYQVESELMLHNLKLKFEDLVQYNQKTFQNTKSVTIKITKDEDQLHETVIALMNAKYNPKKFCEFLLENVFEPIITQPVSIEFDEENSEFVSLQLSYSLKPLGTNLRPNYKIVFQNIRTAISCLGYMNISISETVCVFSIFSDYIKEKFFSLLTQDCLSHFIPDTMDEMNESTIVDDIIEFNKFLTDMLLLNEEVDDNLLKYAERIGKLFRNRFCTNILDNAIDIMRKDLHDMVLVSEINHAVSGQSNPIVFPRCMISKSILELISLMEKVIKQANASSDTDISDRLLSTVSIILDRYLTEVPTYNANLLMKIPQQTALFRNNSMYLAFWLAKNSDKEIDEFATIAKALQKQGNDQFEFQKKHQRTQLIEILNEFGDLTESISGLNPVRNKIVGQCLRQLDLLKNVWQTILPDDVYNKTMGDLLNDFCNEIIRRVLIVEDIPTDVADGLVTICSTIIQRAPSIFEDPLQITVNVPSWMKLAQLKMILGASLIQITEQWSEGKGPLTLNYKADEIKFLIRALFQNTDRRANALASIL